MSNANITNTYTMFCNPNGARRLAKDFQPGKYDVLCARGKKAHESEGNRRFRALVKLHQEKYAACTCKVEKSKIVSHIVTTVRNASPDGGFVKIIDGEYWEAGDRAAKEKVGQTFRDLLHTKYSSSTKAKARARMERKGQQPKVRNHGLSLQQLLGGASPDPSTSSIVSDDSSNNEDSSYVQMSPTPQKSLWTETPSFFQQPSEPLNVIEALRDSMHTIEGNVHNSLRSSGQRNSLLRSSIQTLEDPRSSMMRSSIHSFSGNPLQGAVLDVPMSMSTIENEFSNNIMELDLDTDLVPV